MKKLNLNRETLCPLDQEALAPVAAGASVPVYLCVIVVRPTTIYTITKPTGTAACPDPTFGQTGTSVILPSGGSVAH
jgi:hypothetical protein